MNRYDRLRRRSLYSFIVFLGLSALLAVWAVLSGQFGWFELRVLLTTLTISVTSIDCMGCAVYLEQRGTHWMPLAGMVLAIVAGLLVIAGAWADIGTVPYWKSTAVAGTFAVACTHASLLALASLPRQQAWLQEIARTAIFSTAALVSVAILQEIGEINYYKLVSVIAIAVALSTLVIPLLHWLNFNSPSEEHVLSLTLVQKNLYRAANGRLYRVTPAEAVVDDPTGEESPG